MCSGILILDKVHLKTRILKKGHFIMNTMPTHYRDLTIINAYVPNNRASNYTKQN